MLVSQGVIQTLSPNLDFTTLTGAKSTLAVGPVASQEVIKELGTNGGGFFNVNSAMPFENPNGITNFLELFLILIIPAGLTATFGRMVGSRRQGWALYVAMFALLIVGVAIVYAAEAHGSVAQHAAGIAGGNLEGKETRFGITNSALWSAITTVTSCGAVNAALDSLTGIGGAIPMSNMMIGEVAFGGVGSGLYGMLLFVLLAVFIAGLMVGRTPEYLGKKIEAREVKLVMIGTLAMPLLVLFTVALATATKYGAPSLFNSGPAGLLRAPLRLHVAGEQQRLGVRRLHRLRAAQLARQRRRVRDHLRRRHGRPGDVRRALPAHARRAGGRRARSSASGSRRSARARCAPTRRSSSCSSSA